MDVGVEAAGGEDLALARDHLGAGADDDGDARLDVGIAGLADRMDEPVLDADVGLDDPPVVEDQRVGDHGVDRAAGSRDLRLAHAVADHLAAAELHLLAISGEILLDLDHKLGVGEPDPVAHSRPEHVGVSAAGKGGRGQRGSWAWGAPIRARRGTSEETPGYASSVRKPYEPAASLSNVSVA